MDFGLSIVANFVVLFILVMANSVALFIFREQQNQQTSDIMHMSLQSPHRIPDVKINIRRNARGTWRRESCGPGLVAI